MRKFLKELIGPVDRVDVIEAAAVLGGFFGLLAFMAIICFNVR